MKNFTLQEDIRLLYVTAKKFPDGILDAFKELEGKLPDCDRPFYGISKPNEKGVIVYKAAALEKEKGEGGNAGLETFVIPNGEYLTETLYDFKQNPTVFGDCFDRLLRTPQLDPASYCIEWYKSEEEVLCMVKLKVEK